MANLWEQPKAPTVQTNTVAPFEIPAIDVNPADPEGHDIFWQPRQLPEETELPESRAFIKDRNRGILNDLRDLQSPSQYRTATEMWINRNMPENLTVSQRAEFKDAAINYAQQFMPPAVKSKLEQIRATKEALINAETQTRIQHQTDVLKQKLYGERYVPAGLKEDPVEKARALATAKDEQRREFALEQAQGMKDPLFFKKGDIYLVYDKADPSNELSLMKLQEQAVPRVNLAGESYAPSGTTNTQQSAKAPVTETKKSWTVYNKDRTHSRIVTDPVLIQQYRTDNRFIVE